MPGTQDVEANTATAIAGLSIADPDADPGSVTTTLSVLHGTLTVASAGGGTVGGSGTNTVEPTLRPNRRHAPLLCCAVTAVHVHESS